MTQRPLAFPGPPTPPEPRVYVVCVWYETTDGQQVWRASVRHDLSGQRLYFANPALLLSFISQGGLPGPALS